MIFVTVGTHTAPFDRLIRAMDEFARTTIEPVVMQVGYARWVPCNVRWFRFTSSEEMLQYVTQARVVVAQGATSILIPLRLGVPVVAVPRQHAFREHIDDHQVTFVRKLAERGLVTPVEDIAMLPAAIRTVTHRGPLAPSEQRAELVAYVGHWLHGVADSRHQPTPGVHRRYLHGL